MIQPKIAFFHPYFGDGGVERGIFLLSARFAARGVKTEVVTLRPKVHPRRESFRLIDLGTSRAILSVLALKRYLDRERPDCMVGAQSYANLIAIAANLFARRKTRLVVTERVAISKERIEYPRRMGLGRFKSGLILLLMRFLYGRSDLVAANSIDGASDVEKTLGFATGRVKVLYNPTYDPEIVERAKEPKAHPWFERKDKPIIMGIGRLSRQKDFGTLIKAFKKAAAECDCRLVLLGEGGERSQLEALCAELRVAERVLFLGFQANPYPFLARADLFVLSSLYEGLPNALIEAVALGVPAISTDCLSGPREILLGGKGGRLVAVGDPEGMADAIVEALRDPAGSERLARLAREGLSRFESNEAASGYLEACLPGWNAGPPSSQNRDGGSFA